MSLTHPNSIPLAEVIAECDRLFGSNSPEALGEHLRLWRKKAAEAGDRSAELTILNELIGHYRMGGNAAAGKAAVRDALQLLHELGQQQTAAGGTILLNAATLLHSTGDIADALELYEQALHCYKLVLPADDLRFAGLWNNMAAAYLDLGKFSVAGEYYCQALKILQQHNVIMDMAVTYVNLAQLYRKTGDMERSAAALADAVDCFNSPAAVRDGYYAHTCSKCAAAFGELGYIELQQELDDRAKEIYERA